MYVNETILTLKVPHADDEENGQKFPYNEVRVIGVSPITHSKKGTWEGADAQGVIIVPLTNFGATLDEPFGKLRGMYDVKSEPEPMRGPAVDRLKAALADAQRIEGSQAGKTPEEVFAVEAPGEPAEEGQIRARTPHSPLGDPGGPADADGPLGAGTL